MVIMRKQKWIVVVLLALSALGMCPVQSIEVRLRYTCRIRLHFKKWLIEFDDMMYLNVER